MWDRNALSILEFLLLGRPDHHQRVGQRHHARRQCRDGRCVGVKRFGRHMLFMADPQRRSRDAQLVQQPAHQRNADPDHVRGVAVDAVDEPASQAVEREGSGHL
ncbi:Uncharacterised protein [Mycobacteroides abscessus subsp. massiliense]|nr:Uncharacterised protein [Mycobacteroides abscessus subsp. massiliense]